MTDEEHLGLIALIVRELGDEGVVIGGTGSNDTRHAIHLTEKAVEAGVDAVLSVTPYYNKPNRRGILAHFSEVAEAAGDTPVVLYNIPGRTAINMPPDLLAELAQIDGIDAVKQANSDELQLIDGLAVLAGNDDIYARCLDIGGAGGICVASHVVGNEMRRMYDEPEARAEIDASLQEVYAAMFITASPAPVKAALKMLGHDTGPLRLPLVECDDDGAHARPRRARRATACSRGSPPRERQTPRPPARRRRRDRQEHDGRRVRRPDRRRRLRPALPDGRDDGHRPRPARLHATCASNVDAIEAIVITHGHEDHLGALPWVIRDLGQDKIPVVYGGQLTIAMARSKLDEHKLRDVQPRGAADRRRRRGRPVQDRAHPPDALDPGLQRRRAHDRRSAPSSSPATTSSTRRRSAARPPTWRAWPSSAATACCCCAATPRTSTARASPRASRSSARTWTACSRRCEGRIVVTCFASNIHRVQQVVARGRRRTAARSRWSAARCARTSTSAAASATSTSRRGCWCRRARSTSSPTRRSSSSRPGRQGEPLSALRRMAYRDHPQVELQVAATPSSSPRRRSPATSARSTRRSTGSTTSAARSSPPRDAPIHASGHGYAEEVKMMINLTRPKYVMPVHGDFKRMLIHGQLAQAVGVPAENIFRTENGTPLEIDAERRAPRQAGAGGHDLRRRRRHRRRRRRRAARPPHALARTASSSSSRRSPSRTARPSSPPEVLARGVPFLDGNDAFIDELREAVEDSLDRAAEQHITEIDVLESLPARRSRDVHLRPAQAPPDGAAGRRRGLDAPAAGSRPPRPAPGSPRPAIANAVRGEPRATIVPPSRKPTPGIAAPSDSSRPAIRAW